jgi:hypothetical protein
MPKKPKLLNSQLLELKLFCSEDGGECPYWLQEFAVDRWDYDIPYEYLTGDSGTVDEWCCDNIHRIEDVFYEELELARTPLWEILYD